HAHFSLDTSLSATVRSIGNSSEIASQRPAAARRSEDGDVPSKNRSRAPIVALDSSHDVEKPGCRVAPRRGELAMEIGSLDAPDVWEKAADLDHLADEIAELSAHLDAATAHLLDLIREFDVREGWNTGFRSCAAWLSWRVGLDPGAARERVRPARALGTLPRLAQALARGEISF